MKTYLILVALLGLSACSNFEPTPKEPSYDPVTGQLTLPGPCPDWSQTTNTNYLTENHSNYGCAVNRNWALQLADPEDMNHGHGANRPDAEITSGVIDQYRAGKIPLPLTPNESSSQVQ